MVEKSIYQDIQDKLINKYKNSCYENDNQLRITLPINSLNSYYDGNINLNIYIDIEEMNFNMYEITIICEHNNSYKLFSSYINRDHNDNYNILYKNKICYDTKKNYTTEEIIYTSVNNIMISTQLKSINFNKLYNYINNLKYCNITNKLYVKPYTKEYINKYISRVDNCIICNTDTNHKVKCNCLMCIDCCYELFNKNSRDTQCPNCDTNLWIY